MNDDCIQLTIEQFDFSSILLLNAENVKARARGKYRKTNYVELFMFYVELIKANEYKMYRHSIMTKLMRK